MIRVRFFAALREKIGRDSLDVEVRAQTSVEAIIEAIRTQVGELAAAAVRAPNIRIAVNREFVGRDVSLRDGDEIAFMPPITGG